MGDKARTQSTKYPCGTCNLECKDGSVSCFKCGCWYHAGDCSGIATSVLRCLQKTSGLIWLCKDCEESGKKLLRDGPDDINEIGSKLACIQKQLTDRQLNENKLENTVQKFIDERLLHIEQKLENKINLVIEKQQQIPDQIKTSWQKSNVSTPIPNMKKIMKETLQQQEQEKEDNEKRENNLVLFNVPESKLETPKERESVDLQVFLHFCEEGLRIDLDENQIEKVIRIGKVSNEGSPKPRPLKIVLKEKRDKINIFRSLRNLKESHSTLQLISVSHDYSRQTREKINSMIEEAKKKDGDDSINYRYTIRGTASQLQLQKRRRKTVSNAAASGF